MRHAAEVLFSLPLAAAVHRNFTTTGTHYAVDASGLSIGEQLPLAARLAEVHSPVAQALADLKRQYRRAYHSTSKHKIGDITVTVDHWNEPDSIPDHNEVNTLRSRYDVLANRVTDLTNRRLIDPINIEEIEVVQNEDSKVGRGVATLAVYVPAFGALVFYDEAVAHNADPYSSRTLSEKVEAMNTPGQISRRKWCKLGAVGLGLLVQSKFTGFARERQEKEAVYLETELAKTAQLGHLSDADAFRRYFAMSGGELLKDAKRQLSVLRAASKQELRHDYVVDSLVRATTAFENYVAVMEPLLTEGVGTDLGTLTRIGVVTDEVDRLTARADPSGALRVLGEGMAVCGSMALTVAGLEYLNAQYA